VLCSAANYKEEFKDKVVLVTGGSSGIGYETALEFAQFGAKVIIAARDDHPSWFNGTTAAKNINADATVNATGGRARFVKCDMSNVTQVKALFEDIRKHENDLHFAVNSAGIGGPLGVLVNVSGYVHGEHCPIRNNIYGTIYSLMYETRFMLEKNHGGAIVNLASTNGLKATPRGSLYGTSKFGIVGLTRSAADAFATNSSSPHIRVNAVAPTLTNTSLSWQQAKTISTLPSGNPVQPWEGEYITPSDPLWYKTVAPSWIAKLPGKHIADPSMMAKAIIFLCSSDASYITGHILSVDRGGLA